MGLDRIQTVLGLSRTKLAVVFGVRLLALERWGTHGVPAEHQEKLETVEAIADLLAAKLEGDLIPDVVRRPSSVYRGRSTLDAIADNDQELVLTELRHAFDWEAA